MRLTTPRSRREGADSGCSCAILTRMLSGDMTGALPPAGAEGARAALLIRVARLLLRPLARALLAEGMTAPAFERLARTAFVEAAEAEIARAGRKPTVSAISLMTGVHRRDVNTLRDPDRQAEDALRERAAVLATVIARWLAAPGFTDAKGGPAPLSPHGEGASFDALCASVSRDVRPRAIRDELERQGLVEADGEGRLHLLEGALRGPADREQALIFLAENVGDHIAAGAENLAAETPRHVERALFYNRLSPASAEELAAAARREAQRSLTRLNRLAHRLQGRDASEPSNRARFRFGLYVYRDGDALEGEGREGGGDD